MKSKIHIAVSVFLMALTSAGGYEVFTAMPYVPADAAKNIRLWDQIAMKSEGLSLNTSDTQAKVRNTPKTWKASMEKYGKAKNNGLVAIPRTSWSFGENKSKGTLEERLAIKFRDEKKLGAKIRWVMLYGSQPGEDRTKDAYGYTQSDIWKARKWLDDLEEKGHAPVALCWNVRNSSKDEKDKCLDPNVDAILIEGSPEKWYSNSGRRQDFLKWVTSEPKTREKPLIFQVPFNQHPEKEDLYFELRKFVHWIASEKMMGNYDLLRREDVAFLPITYNSRPDFYPEKNESGTEYMNTLAGAALSLIEQRERFEGRSTTPLTTADLKDRSRKVR